MKSLCVLRDEFRRRSAQRNFFCVSAAFVSSHETGCTQQSLLLKHVMIFSGRNAAVDFPNVHSGLLFECSASSYIRACDDGQASIRQASKASD